MVFKDSIRNVQADGYLAIMEVDCASSAGPFGVLECLSHEVIEKVAICLDLHNLKKLSKVSTAFRGLATSVGFYFLNLSYMILLSDLLTHL